MDLVARMSAMSATVTVFADDEDGTVIRFAFPNGFGASVSRTRLSYGSCDGLFEVAVLDAEGNITCDTPITKDVLPRLTAGEVIDVLTRISGLT